MKKLALVIIFSLVAATAFGQWAENNVGVYFSTDPLTNYVDGVLPNSLVHCYVVGTGLTAGSTAGFEMTLTTVGDGFFLPTSIVYPTQAANLAGRVNEYFVGYDSPQPIVGGQFTFMEYDVLVTGPQPICTYIAPLYFPSVPGTAAYLDGADLEIILPLYNSTGDPLNPDGVFAVASINGLCEGAVPAEDASWGDVKSLFR